MIETFAFKKVKKNLHRNFSEKFFFMKIFFLIYLTSEFFIKKLTDLLAYLFIFLYIYKFNLILLVIVFFWSRIIFFILIILILYRESSNFLGDHFHHLIRLSHLDFFFLLNFLFIIDFILISIFLYNKK